jgi:hypothetical protein
MPEPNITDELRNMESEPLLPAEKKLIVWSIVIGLMAIIVLAWIGRTFLRP